MERTPLTPETADDTERELSPTPATATYLHTREKSILAQISIPNPYSLF